MISREEVIETHKDDLERYGLICVRDDDENVIAMMRVSFMVALLNDPDIKKRYDNEQK